LPANDPDVLVVGGGVVGLFCAYYLRLSGCDVVLVEQGAVGGPQSCSHGNSGFVGTQGAAPLNEPFELPGGADASLRSWLAHYRDAGDAAAASALLLELKKQSLDILRALHPAGFTDTGMVLAFKTPRGFEQARRSGVAFHALSPDELRGLELDVHGGLYNPDGGYVRAPEFVTELARMLEGMGVSIREQERVVGFEAANGLVSRVHTDRGEYRPHETVLAAGVDTVEQARLLGLDVALQPVKGYSVTIETPYAPRLPILLGEARVAVAPLGGGRLRFAGGLHLSGVDSSPESVLSAVRSYLPRMEWAGTVEVWSGLRPCTPDSLPFLGRAYPYRNVTIACGHGTIGMGMAPASGRLIAQLLAGGGPTDIDLKPFRVDRYPRGA